MWQHVHLMLRQQVAAERVNVPWLHLHSISPTCRWETHQGSFEDGPAFLDCATRSPKHKLWIVMAILWQNLFFSLHLWTLKIMVLLKFDVWSAIVMSTWLICQHRQKLRQELPSRIEEAKRSGVRPLLKNVKGWTWKTLGQQQLRFSVLEGCVFVILPWTTPLVCGICSEQHPLISFGMR